MKKLTDKELIKRCFKFIDALYQSDYAAATIDRMGLEDELFAIHEACTRRLIRCEEP